MLGVVREVWFGQAVVHRVQGGSWCLWMIGEGWILLEGKKPTVTVSLQNAGAMRDQVCLLGPNP